MHAQYIHTIFIHTHGLNIAETDKDQKISNEGKGWYSTLDLQSSDLIRMPRTNITILYNFCLNEESFHLFKH